MKAWGSCIVVAGAALLVGMASAESQVRTSEPVEVLVREQRMALVIGNGDYDVMPLKNPVNDAKDIADALRPLGFKVMLVVNATRRDMKRALGEFRTELKKGGVGLFYYAGHGLQVKGRNYLVPVNARIEIEADIEDESLDADLVINSMEDAGNRVNIVILDACRNNPYAGSFRSASRGLAPMETKARGSFIAYSTAPGSVAADGEGRNGLYTKHLLASLRAPDSDIEKVFKRVRTGVATETRNAQIPWDSSSLLGDFRFNPAEIVAEKAAPARTDIGSPVPESPRSGRREQQPFNMPRF